MHGGNHREHDFDFAIGRCSQNRSQLRAEHGGLSQAEPNSPQSQCRISNHCLSQVTTTINGLICPQIEGANGDRLIIHTFDNITISGELFFLFGWSQSVHIEKFGPIQSDTLRPGIGDSGNIFWQFRIGQKRNGLAITGTRRLGLIATQR